MIILIILVLLLAVMIARSKPKAKIVRDWSRYRPQTVGEQSVIRGYRGRRKVGNDKE